MLGLRVGGAIDIAARKGSVEIMSKLLDVGVDVDAFRHCRLDRSRYQDDEDFKLRSCHKQVEEDEGYVDDFERRSKIAAKKR